MITLIIGMTWESVTEKTLQYAVIADACIVSAGIICCTVYQIMK